MQETVFLFSLHKKKIEQGKIKVKKEIIRLKRKRKK